MTIEHTGTLIEIQKSRPTNRGSVWPFVLQVEGSPGRPQTYLISAYSDKASEDPFGLMDFEGQTVRVKCYLNGNKYNGKHGIAYINELKLISIAATK